MTRAQLRAAGLSPEAIKTRVRRGALIPRHHRVFAVGHVPDTWLSRAYAGWLACGRTSGLSHVTCAAALAVLPEPDGPIHLTRPTKGPSQSGLVLHRAEIANETWRRRNLLLTCPTRMLLDLAATESLDTLERAYDQAQVLKLVTRQQVLTALEHWDGRRGVRALRATLDVALDAVTRSEMERLFRKLIADSRIENPKMNVWREGMLVDAVWDRERVVVELDSRTFHATDARFERDRAKSNHLLARRWLPLRFTYRRLRDEPLAVIAEIAAALTLGERSGAIQATGSR